MSNEHPYPAAFRSGDLVTGALVAGGFDAECAQAFANLDVAPARSCVGVAALPYGGVVEVEALARVRDV